MTDGDRFVRCDRGHLHWGRFGAAGLLPHHDGHVLLQHRALLTIGGGTWGVFGGARASGEDSVTAALRETSEESTLPVGHVRVHGLLREEHGGWSYDTVIGSVGTRRPVAPASWETRDAAWVPVDEVERMRLFGPFAAAWPRLRACLHPTALIVDTANVMGSRADGWWRDRAGAARRLRDQLTGLTSAGVPGWAPFDVAFPEITMIVEGAARDVEPTGPVRVESAPASGDDTIVDLVTARMTAEPDVSCLVITADRELRRRCEAVGAAVTGPRWLLSRLP